MSTQKSEQRMNLLKQYLKGSKEKCDDKCATIDADVLAKQQTSGTMNDKEQKGKEAKKQINKKDDMKLENPSVLARDIPSDGTSKTKTDNQYDVREIAENSWTDEEKADFDKEWAKKEQKQSTNNVSEELVDDPEAAAMGGFDRGSGNEDEMSLQKEGGTGDDEKNIEELDPSAITEVREGDKKNEADMEQLRVALDKARDALVTKKRRAETSVDKIKSLLGRVSVGNVSDEIKQIEDEYNSILMQLKDKLLQERDSENTSEERKREINAEIKFMAINEGIKLNDAETKVRLETKWGAIGNKINKVGLWYKNLPKSVKYAMTGALFAGGAALTMSGGGVVAGGALASIKGLKRIFGATAVGAGVGAGLEAKVNAKRQKKLMEAMKKFGEMSLEEQNEVINGIDNFNNKTQEEYEKIKTSRRRIKFAAISSAAALLVGGKVVSHFMSGDSVSDAVHEHVSGEHLRVLSAQELAQETKYGESVFNSMSQEFTDEMKHTKAFEVFKNKYGPDAYLKYLQNGGDDTKWQKKVENALKLYKESAKHQLAPNVTSEDVPSGGVHEGPGTPWLEKELEADHEKVSSDGTIIKDTFEQEADKTFSQYQFNNKIPDISETVAATEVSAPELSEISVNVKPGDNLWNLIKAQLETNSQFEGMTEDQRIMAIDELKDKFASMSHEDLKSIGFRSGDINKIYPGDKLNLTSVMGNSETIKHALSTGKHFTGELETHGVPVSEHGNIASAEKAVDTKAISSDAQYIIHHNYGLTDEEFARIEDTPVSEILDQAVGKDPSTWTPLERDLMEFNGLDERVGQQTVGEVLRETTLHHANDTVAGVTQEHIQEVADSAANQFEGMTESEVLRELVGNREFKIAVAQQIQEIFGTKNITDALRNIAPKDMNFFLSEGYVGQEKEMVLALRDRAVKAFGDSGNPKPGAKVGQYITRMLAKAVHEGKVKDVFPSSTFSK